MKNVKNKIKAFIPIAIIVALLSFPLLFPEIRRRSWSFCGKGRILGMIAYVAIAIIATVAAPVSATPLIPIAAGAWGAVLTAMLSIFGWTIGSLVAFAIGRRYGLPLVQKFVSGQKLEKLHKHIPHERVFWSVVLLRIMIPVDL